MKNKIVDLLDVKSPIQPGNTAGGRRGRKTNAAASDGMKRIETPVKTTRPAVAEKKKAKSAATVDFESQLAHAIPSSALPVPDARRVTTAPRTEAGTAGPGNGPTSKTASVGEDEGTHDEADAGIGPTGSAVPGAGKAKSGVVAAAGRIPVPAGPVDEATPGGISASLKAPGRDPESGGNPTTPREPGTAAVPGGTKSIVAGPGPSGNGGATGPGKPPFDPRTHRGRLLAGTETTQTTHTLWRSHRVAETGTAPGQPATPSSDVPAVVNQADAVRIGAPTRAAGTAGRPTVLPDAPVGPPESAPAPASAESPAGVSPGEKAPAPIGRKATFAAADPTGAAKSATFMSTAASSPPADTAPLRAGSSGDIRPSTAGGAIPARTRQAVLMVKSAPNAAEVMKSAPKPAEVVKIAPKPAEAVSRAPRIEGASGSVPAAPDKSDHQGQRLVESRPSAAVKSPVPVAEPGRTPGTVDTSHSTVTSKPGAAVSRPATTAPDAAIGPADTAPAPAAAEPDATGRIVERNVAARGKSVVRFANNTAPPKATDAPRAPSEARIVAESAPERPGAESRNAGSPAAKSEPLKLASHETTARRIPRVEAQSGGGRVGEPGESPAPLRHRTPAATTPTAPVARARVPAPSGTTPMNAATAGTEAPVPVESGPIDRIRTSRPAKNSGAPASENTGAPARREAPSSKTEFKPVLDGAAALKIAATERPASPAPLPVNGSGIADPFVAAVPVEGGAASSDHPQRGAVVNTPHPPAPATPWPVALSPRSAERLRGSLAAALREGRSDLTIELEPAHLGRLKIHLEVSGQSVTAHLLTETSAARHALEAHKADLALMLQEQGLRLEQFDVGLDRAPQRDPEDRNPRAFEHNRNGPGGGGNVESPATTRSPDRVALGLNHIDRVA